MKLHWWSWYQNNSGGHWDVDEDVAHHVFVQAPDEATALARFEYITRNQSSSCECCGSRWSLPDESMTDEPMIYGTPLFEYETFWHEPQQARLHYIDGKVEKVIIPPERSRS